MKIEEKYNHIYQKSPIGIIICDNIGKIVYANHSALKIVQLSKLEDFPDNNIFTYPSISTKKELLVREGVIEFQESSTIIKDINKSSGNSEALINWNVSVTDSGFLIQIRDIKKWQKTEKIVQKSEEKFQKFFEDDLTGDFIASPNGKLIMCNPSFVEIYGFENHDQAIKTEISEFNKDDWLCLINMLRTECKIKGYQSWHKRPDGKIIHVVANLIGIFNSSGVLTEVKGYIYDDTDRKKAEEFLQASEEKYHSLFDEDLTGDFIATIDGEILECNPAFAEIYGFTNRDLASKCNISKFNSFDWPYMITRLRKECKLQGFQSWQRRSDGMRIHIVANLVGIFNDLNELIEVKGYVFDDTDRKQAEEELARSKHQMNDILDSIQDGFIALSHYWHFIYSNKCASEYFKVEYDELIGQNLWDTLPELKGTVYEASFKKAIETQEIQHFEVKGLHNIDQCFDFTVYPSADGISVYWRNISARKNYN